MAAYDTIVQQGRFTADGNKKSLSIRSDVDFIEVYNLTQAGAQQTPGRGIYFYWQRGMANGSAFEWKKADGADTMQLTTVNAGGVRLLDTSESPVGALNNSINQVDLDLGAGGVPRVLLADTTGLENGDIVRLINITDRQELAGYDYTINALTANTGFDLPYLPTGLANDGNGGSLRLIRFNPVYYPRRRTISSITQAQQAVVTVTVDHQFTVGQTVRINNPSSNVFGMPEIDGLQGRITAVDTTGNNNSLTLDIDTSAFAAFNFPAQNAPEFTPAEVVPVGSEGDGISDNQATLDDATRNTAFLGVELGSGAQSPAGSNGDVIYWRAGRGFRIDNQ